MNKIFNNDAFDVCSKINLKKLENKKVLVVGGNGLIGLNIINVLDYYNKHFSKKKIKISSISLTKPFFKIKDIRYFVGDITNEKFINKIPNAHYIFFTAGYGQPKKFLKYKKSTILINTFSLIKFSEKIINRGKLIYMSSSEIYSGNKKHIYSENDLGQTASNHPRSIYIEGKKCGEAIVHSLINNKINAVSLRISLAYGPGVKKNDSRVMNELIVKSLKGDIFLKDAGNAIRTYCYISDIIRMILNITLRNRHSVYNIGGVSTLSIKDLAKKISYNTKKKLILGKKEYMKDAPKRVKLSIKRFEHEFGKQKFINIDTGLKRTIDWYKSIR